MDGSNLQPLANPNQFASAKDHSRAPSPLYPAVSKLLSALLCLGVMILLSQYFSFHSVIGKYMLITLILAPLIMLIE